MRSSRPRRHEGGTGSSVRGAAGPGLAAAGRQDFQRPEHQPRRSLLRQSPQQLLGRERFGQFDFHDLVSPSIPTAKAKGNVIRGLG